jgi:hypothetical protein
MASIVVRIFSLRLALLVLALAGCAGQKEPARMRISDLDSMVAAAAPDAAKYVPQQLAQVQGELGELKASFDKNEYAAVLEGAPRVMGAAHELARAAAAKRAAQRKAQDDEWTTLAAAVPDEMTLLQRRIDFLGRKTSKQPAARIDPDAARGSLREDASLWSKAQAAFATGNMEEAVATAEDVKMKLGGLAGELQLAPAAGSAAPTPP